MEVSCPFSDTGTINGCYRLCDRSRLSLAPGAAGLCKTGGRSRAPTSAPPPLRDVTPGASLRPEGVVSAALGGRCQGPRMRLARAAGDSLRAYVRARRSRVAGSARGVGSLPAAGQARALAATAMSAIIEQEFQKIDATNDWQARYLVSERGRSGAAPAGGRTGRGPRAGSARCRSEPPQRGAEAAGPRLAFRCTQRNCRQPLRMRPGGGRRCSLGGGAGGRQRAGAVPRALPLRLRAARRRGCWRRTAPARSRRRPEPLSRVLAAGSGGLSRAAWSEPGQRVLPAVSRQSGKLHVIIPIR